MSFRKVLVATDFSDGSRRAVEVATRLATTQNAELVIAHAWNVPTALGGELPIPSEVVREIEDEAVRGLGDALREAKQLGARATSRLVHGPATRAIVRQLDDPSFDLVVVGTRGRTGLPRILLGSVATSIVRHAPVSTLVVRPDNVAIPFEHVLCPTDFSDQANAALALAEELAEADGAKLTLLHVAEVAFYGGRGAAQFIHYLERTSREQLARATARTRDRITVPVDGVNAIGSAGGQTLARIDDDKSIDLVVIGSHGRTGIERVVFGSVAEKVVRHARCPVLVARTRHA